MSKYYSGLKLIYKYIREVFPAVDDQLGQWVLLGNQIGDEVLKTQALSSISKKKFHVQGGSVYSLYPGTDVENTIGFITAFQTISDYLDNLCDRAGVFDEAAFRQLHIAMMDAVDLRSVIHDYYLYYPYKNDSGYLKSLVEECRHRIQTLPSYNVIVEPLKKYIGLYSDLQTYKHIEPSLREERLNDWAHNYLSRFPGITCWEFSAAAGSTLGVFILFAAAYNPDLTAYEVKRIEKAYFPWVCGLHILLDYFIDSKEDMLEDDLNFTSYYENPMQCEERLTFFLKRSLHECKSLKYPEFHKTIIKGLLAMYLSDPKAASGRNRYISKSLVKHGGGRAFLYQCLCKLLRRAGIL